MIDKFWHENDYHREEYNGLQIVLRRNFQKAWCGYVGVPSTHPLYRKQYSERLPVPDRGAIDTTKLSPLSVLCEAMREDDGKVALDLYFQVHGGVTFSNGGTSVYPLGQPNDLWWFGFDCSHAGDLTPRDAFRNDFPRIGEYRDQEYALTEARSLADQLLAFEVSK